MELATWAIIQQDQRAACQCQGNGILWPKQRNRTGLRCVSLRIICHPDAEHTRKRRQTSSCIFQPSSHWRWKTLFPDRKGSTSNHLGSWEAPSLSLQQSFQIDHWLQACSADIQQPKLKPPPRIERWNLRLQGYDFEVVHTEGSPSWQSSIGCTWGSPRSGKDETTSSWKDLVFRNRRHCPENDQELYCMPSQRP